MSLEGGRSPPPPPASLENVNMFGYNEGVTTEQGCQGSGHMERRSQTEMTESTHSVHVSGVEFWSVL